MNNEERMADMLKRVGSLSDEERAELELLTGKERVMRKADKQVAVVISRRKRLLTMTAVVALAASALVTLWPNGAENPIESQPMVAELPESAIDETADEPVLTVIEEPQRHEYVAEKRTPIKKMKVEAAEKPVAALVPEVKCNSVCDADSVISEIWHFLSA